MDRKRLLNVSPIDGTRTWWHDSDAHDDVVIEEEMFTEPLLELNYEKRKEHIGTKIKMGDGNHHVADLPMALLFKLKAMGHWEPGDPTGKKLLTWLRDHPRWAVTNGRYI